MSDTQNKTEYFVMERSNQRGMLLYSLPDPSDDDSWTMGQRFSVEPETPIEIEIITGHEKATLLPYFGTPPLMSNALYELLLGVGVDNLDVYDAVIRSEDGSVEFADYKAFNLIGLVSAAGPGTKYDTSNASRLIDASIESLSIDAARARGALMFRLAEYAGAVVVHRSVKEAIEAAKIPFIAFREPEEFIS